MRKPKTKTGRKNGIISKIYIGLIWLFFMLRLPYSFFIRLTRAKRPYGKDFPKMVC